MKTWTYSCKFAARVQSPEKMGRFGKINKRESSIHLNIRPKLLPNDVRGKKEKRF